MIDQELNSFVKDKILIHSNRHKTLSDRITLRCPCCGDSRKSSIKMRGNFYFSTGLFSCFNCGITLPAFPFLEKLTNQSISELKKEFLKYESGNEYIQEDVIEKKTIKLKVDELPSDWIDLNEDCNKFIKSRRIYDAPNLPYDFKMYFSRKEQRLVIPWKENGVIKYYQTRALYKNQEPKYKFPYNTAKYIFGLETLDQDFQYIFYTEGALDSIWIKNGIAIGGLNLTDDQHKLLNEYFTNTPILFTDNQWVDNASKELILKIAKSNPTQKVFLWPKHIKDKDVNDFVIRNNTSLFYDDIFLTENITSALKASIKLTF